MSRITSTELRQRLHYDPATGVFTWLKPGEFHPRIQGKQAGFVHGKNAKHRYRRIGIGGTVYMGLAPGLALRAQVMARAWNPAHWGFHRRPD